MKSLEHIVTGVNVLHIRGDLGQQLAQVTLDSREVERGAMFVALRGTVIDGHQFIDRAVRSGAAAVMAETTPPDDLPDGVCWIQVADTRSALSQVAANLYEHPSTDLKLVGVTGTNGKTSVVYILNQLFTALGYPCGLISTVEICWPGHQEPARLTTPDILTIQRLLRDMANAGVTHVFMEVSSHAVHQGRIDGLQFAGGVFTNITHDHLDYHGTFANYIQAKKGFFDHLTRDAFALINEDDRNGKVMVQNTPAHVVTYGLKTMAEYKGRILENRLEGLLMKINDTQIACRLVGDFNAYNLLAAYGTAVQLGIREDEAIRALSTCAGARGRLEVIRHPAGRIGIVDFAHTPDALEKVIQTLRDVRQGSTRVIGVVGCGGDRDKKKRPIMGGIASAGCDLVMFTADNPRSEPVDQILEEMMSGVAPDDRGKVQVIADRRQAIQVAVRLSRAGDVILVAGKGHEAYQEVGGVRHPFDDVQVLNEALEIPVIS